MALVSKHDKKLLGELFIIIGGFVFADTLVRKFLEVSQGNLHWSVLPLLSLLIIMSGVNLRENKESPRSFISVIFLATSIILLVGSFSGLDIWWFISFTIIFGIVMILWTLISWFMGSK